MKNKQKYILISVLLLFILAFYLRVVNISNVPGGIYPDEAVNGTDAILANETGEYPWFYTNNFGREGLYINLVAISVKLFSNTELGLKFISILSGALLVVGVFLLTQELFKNLKTSFIAGYLTAFSFWAINFSRIAFRAIMLPMLLTFSFYFFFRGLRRKKYLDFILSGLFLGLSFQTYIASRITPAIFLVVIVLLIFTQEKFLKLYWKKILVFSLAVILGVSTLLIYFIQNPDSLSSRSGEISVFSEKVNQGNLIYTLSKSVFLSLIKYNFWGDQNWRHNYPPYPILNPTVGIAFLIILVGLVYKVIKFLIFYCRHKFKFAKTLNEDRSSTPSTGSRTPLFNQNIPIQVKYIFILSWFFIMLAPEFLTAEGLPHALRAIGTLPVVYIMASLFFSWILKKSKNYTPSLKLITYSSLIFILMFVGVFNLFKYFYFWGNNPQQRGAFNINYKNMAMYLNDLSPNFNFNKYVIANGEGRLMEDNLPVSAHSIKFFTYKKTTNLIFLSPETNFNNFSFNKPGVIILMKPDESLINQIKNNYPKSKISSDDFTKIIIY